MKLLNYTTSYIAAILLIIVSVWAGIFYYAILDEIYDSIDDGLDNQRILIIEKAKTDTAVLNTNFFDEGGYSIKRVDPSVQLKDAFIDTSMYMLNEKDFEPVRMLTTSFKQDGEAFELKVVTSMVEEDDLVKELLFAIVWLYVCIILALIFLNNIVLRKIWSPFYHLLSQLKKFRLDHQKPISPAPSKVEEFQILSKTVDDMVQSNINTYSNQKSFIENAAHELQTPLAITINKLEALTEIENVPHDQLLVITSAIENLGRLARLNQSMLLLSRIENNQFHKPQEVFINDISKEMVEGLKDQFEYKNINIIFQEEGNCKVQMDFALANSLILNLIKNALVYNCPDGYICIIITPHRFTITNPGSRALNPEKIFTRFYKETPSSISSGLGLAIVKSIADYYHFGIQYEFNNGHNFHINFNN